MEQLKQKQIIIFLYMQSFDIERIAQILKISKSEVKEHVAKIKDNGDIRNLYSLANYRLFLVANGLIENEIIDIEQVEVEKKLYSIVEKWIIKEHNKNFSKAKKNKKPMFREVGFVEKRILKAYFWFIRLFE